MGLVLDIYDKIADKPLLVQEFWSILDTFALTNIEEPLIKPLIMSLTDLSVGCHFTPERLILAFNTMENKDGSMGAHWAQEDTDSVAVQVGLDFGTLNYNNYDFNYVLNMVYSDYFKTTRTLNDYVDLALDYLNDLDGVEGKAYRYWKKVIFEKDC